MIHLNFQRTKINQTKMLVNMKMKAVYLFIWFLIFSISISISIHSFSRGAAVAVQLPDDHQPVVLDRDGNELQVGVKYYILPVFRGFGGGGGLTVSSTLNKKADNVCPRAVIQEMLEIKRGIPLTFTPVNHGTLVHTSTDLNIKFSPDKITNTAKSCGESYSYVWKVEQLDHDLVVATGGVEGNPGRETVSNWFKIEKLEDDYKLVFCPSVCSFCKVVCKDIGVLMQLQWRRLALTDSSALKVHFKKA